ncbi:MAG TPA: carboxypeptidase-like regulatory domain-containing protein, partial [Acidobacteriaceae bacterium]|nr:carboxypeptidase-like regulatory domain-containing protein [Acidobacteriaceae bacterium]
MSDGDSVLFGSILLSAVWLISACSSVASAQTSDVIRGRVIDRDKRALARVDVSVATETGEHLQSAQTDQDGRYAIVVPQPHDTYVVSFRRVGYVQFSRIVHRTGLGNTFEVGEVALAPRLDLLEPIVIRSAVLVPSRAGPPALGAAELDAAGGRDFTIDPSEIAGLVAQLPGVQPAGDGGFSVLGAAPDQNRTMVDGMDFVGGRVPRDAIERTKL